MAEVPELLTVPATEVPPEVTIKLEEVTVDVFTFVLKSTSISVSTCMPVAPPVGFVEFMTNEGCWGVLAAVVKDHV